jgi:hypothetical protein
MLADLDAFLLAAADGLDAAEAAFLCAESSEGAAAARRGLADIAGAAAAGGYLRAERIARAADALIAHGGAARHLVVRAFLRLRDVLRALADCGEEPAGEDSDLVAAAQSDRLPSLADTLAHARDRLLEISAEHRDPRLEALLERLASLGSELEADARALRDDADIVEPPAPPREATVLRRSEK